MGSRGAVVFISFFPIDMVAGLRYHTGIPLTAPQGQKAPPVTITELIDQEYRNSHQVKFLTEQLHLAQHRFDDLWDEVKAEFPDGLPWDSDNWALLLGAQADVVRAGGRLASYGQQIADAVYARCRNDWDGAGEH